MTSLILLVFPLAMAFAAISDLFTMKIRNNLVLGLAAAFFVAALFAGFGWMDVAYHAGAGLLVLAITFSFFAFGWIGGGDAKFAAATAMWVGFPVLLPYVVYSALLGGALTLFILFVRRFPLPANMIEIDWISRLHHEKTGIPYGIALAVAGIAVFPETALFKALIG